MSGKWIDELIEHVGVELDEPDANGLTPIMHALMYGQEGVIKQLIAKRVSVTDPVPTFDKEGTLKHKSILMVALENIVTKAISTDTLETIRELVCAGALTEIPPLDERRMTSAEMYEQLLDTSHAIGYALALPGRESVGEQVELKYRVVRMMLAAAFREAPGAGLMAFVALATTMREHADRVHLSDMELSTTLEEEAQEIGMSVDKILKTLPELEQQRLLYSIPGDNFMRLAAESGCRKMLFSPVISNHTSSRWLGDYMFALFGEGLGIYQWGGYLELDTSLYWFVLVPMLPLVWMINILLLPLVALYPPFADTVRGVVDSFGEWGVDPRESPRRPEGKPGYSPTLRLWWRSLVLFDVPIFKFFTAQAGVLGLLWLLLYLAPCFDFDNHDECFPTRTVWHMIGDSDRLGNLIQAVFGFDLATMDGNEHALLSYDDAADDTSVVAPVVDAGAAVRRMLKGGRASGKVGSTRRDGGDSEYSSELYEHPIPNVFGMPKDVIYVTMIVYTMMVFMSAVHARPSIATASTYTSAVAAVLAFIYLMADLVFLYEIDNKYDLQPMLLSLSAFLLWMDVARALLLKTFTCGPYVLMLFMMFRDVGIFLIIAVTMAVGFALALFFNGTLKEPSGVDMSDCPFTQGQISTYGLTLIEEMVGLGGVGDQIGCAKREKDLSSRIILEIYLVICMILLMNMLIAMMAETFSKVVSNQEEEYAYLNAQIVVTLDLESGNVPPPFTILRAPAKVLGGLTSLVGPKYKALADGAEGDYKHYTHVAVSELLDALDEVDFESDRADVSGLVLSLKEDLVEGGSITAKKKSSSAVEEGEPSAFAVQAFDGYSEEASRLVFHYSHHFSHLPSNPAQITYLPSGVAENEPKALPITVKDEEPTEKEKAKGENPTQAEMAAKLQSRGLTSYPFAQQVPQKSGRKIIEEVGDTYVYKRLNGEYGLSQIWPIKVNKQFHENFKVSTTNPNPKVFQPQAVVEFERTIKKLFGSDAPKVAPILYAHNTKRNTKPIFKGTAEELQLFLRASPETCDGLKIAKLYPGGFVCCTAVGGNPKKNEPPKKDSFKHFDFTPGIDYVLYTKQGYESMACVKGYFQFISECELGPRKEELELQEDTAGEYSA